MIYKGCLIKDLADNSIWIVKDCQDLHNVQLESKSNGTWIDCFDPNCTENVLSEVKFLNINESYSEGKLMLMIR